LGYQVNILLIPGWCSFFLLISSCQTKPYLGDANEHSIVSESQILSPSDEIAKINFSLTAYHLELKWLNLRKEIVAAEIRSNEAKESELKLERELSNFQKLDFRFPSSQGFISENEQIKWLARLKVKKEETGRLQAVGRLLKRDMNDLENKLRHKGFRYQVPVLVPEPELPSDLNP
jgi:hypothetical protein